MDGRRKIGYGSVIHGQVPTYELIVFLKAHLTARSSNIQVVWRERGEIDHCWIPSKNSQFNALILRRKNLFRNVDHLAQNHSEI